MENLDATIEQYLNGELKGQELRDFERRLQEDDALKKELALHQTIEKSMSGHFRNQEKEEAVLANLQAISSEFFQGEKKIKPAAGRRPIRRIISFVAIAAAAAVILLIWAPWQNSLYQQYSTHPVAAFTQMGTTADVLSQAEQAFNSQDYARASALLNTYLGEHPEHAEVQYFLGISYLESGEYSKADALFQSLRQGNSAYQHEGSWYLALSQVKQGKSGQGKELLESIPSGSDRYEQAQRLLQELD